MINVYRISRGASAVPVSTLAAWLRIDQSDESAGMLQLLIDSATDVLQEYTGRSFVNCTYRVTFTGPRRNQFILPYPKISEVTKFQWVSSTGHAVDITDYQLGSEGRLKILSSSWSSPAEVVVEYDTAGVTDAIAQMAVLKIATYLYERRGDCDSFEALHQSGAGEMVASLKRVLL